jgi:hypothetical protein
MKKPGNGTLDPDLDGPGFDDEDDRYAVNDVIQRCRAANFAIAIRRDLE